MPASLEAGMDDDYLGLDLSTQQIKAVITDSSLKIVKHVFSVNFDADLPEFRTTNGIHKHDDGVTITSPTAMWLKALDLLLARMQKGGVAFGTIKALSGAGQQHGSVYWKYGSEKILSLDPSKSLYDLLKNAFSIANSPIWMDASTGEQCRKLEKSVGGREKLVEITGSRAYHRFTGNQISKIHQLDPQSYQETERISLVSSFGCSLFAGKYAPIDISDGSGMNLLNIHTKTWDHRCAEICAPDLIAKLGTPVPADSVIGKIAPYFVDRYGFPPDCAVIAFTGDNPASMAGINQRPGDVAVSLGTSDTVFLWMRSLETSLNTMTLCNPLDAEDYMGMVCFKNGSLTRERIRKACDCLDWDQFSSILNQTQPGCDGNIGFYFDFPEILPNVIANDFRFTSDDKSMDSFPAQVEARCVLESQCMAKRIHAEEMGVRQFERVLVTGGASVNRQILQILADVFNCDVFVQDVQHSAALGSAYRAKHGLFHDLPFSELCAGVGSFNPAASPKPSAVEAYQKLLPRYRKLEEQIAQNYAQA